MLTGGNTISGISNSVQIYSTRRASSVAQAQERGGASARFDSITLSGTTSFASSLIGRISQEVRASVTPGRLSALSEQIASGEYKPDAMSIARRMLLLPEEN